MNNKIKMIKEYREMKKIKANILITATTAFNKIRLIH